MQDQSATTIYFDADVDITVLNGLIAVIGYGNQGQAQAKNLRDSGFNVIIGNINDEYRSMAESDNFTVLGIREAVEQAQIIILLIPDEVQPEVFQKEILPVLQEDKVLCFASGYNIAFGYIEPPAEVDTIMVAPRMIGAGVRSAYEQSQGFFIFMAVENNHSGKAMEIAKAIAKGIGATKPGGAILEMTFRQEAELDLFNEQCFGPAFGHVLMSAVDVAVEAGYPPEAVIVDIYMSGEFAFNMQKMAEMGPIAQLSLHSPCSQYGSMSRWLRYANPELREQMKETLAEIQNGSFAEEFQKECQNGLEILEQLKKLQHETPLVQLDKEARKKLLMDTND